MFSGLRNFIIVFLIALLGFGVAGHFLALNIIPSLIEGNNDEVDPSGEVSDESSVLSSYESEDSTAKKESGETYSFAVVSLDLNGELAGVFFIHTNEGYETCVYTTIPGSVPLENNGAESTLARIYQANGTEYLMEKLRYITGYSIDGYAVLNAIDTTGNGRSITDLATYLNYTCKVSVPFSYPNPNYIDPSLEPTESSEETSEEFSEETLISEDETSEPDTTSEFIVIPVGDYALNGFVPLAGQAEKLQNYLVLLNSQYNIYAHNIYTDILKSIFTENHNYDTKKIFDYFSEYDIDTDIAYKHLFNKFDKYEYKYPDTAEAWNEAVAALRELEIGEN